MKKTLMVLGVALCATLLVNPALACDGKGAKQAGNDGAACAKSAAEAQNVGASCAKAAVAEAGNEGACCAKSAAKAAYAKALEETGCEKTAQIAYQNALAEHVYAASYAETGCSKTAQKAAYDAVYAETSCEKSSQAAATHAVAKASYDATYATTGCAKTAQAAYDSVTKTAGANCATSASTSGCDKGTTEDAADQVAESTTTKLASADQGSSR